MTAFKKLFTPIKIGSMELKNRIAMAPMTTDYANPDETPSDRQIAYYSERAKGGAGLIGLEVVTVDPKHRYQQHSLGLYSDEQINGHKKLVDAIHAHGAKVQPQISHTGPESLSPFYQNLQPVGPSIIRTQTTMQVCREISVEELEVIIEMYGDTARRAREAGYDGIELHAAHSYMLLGSFLSPLRNHRQDEYAGRKIEGRMKLLLQVLANIRKKVGDDFPITLRMSGYERESGGREINDTQRMAPILVEAGVNCFHVSGGVGDANITQIIAGSEYSSGFNASAAEAIKQVVNVPVMVVGRNMDPVSAENILQKEQADLVVMGRALLADPLLPLKTQTGKFADIRFCTSCEDCVDAMSLGTGVKCAVNARCGREGDLPDQKATVSKKVLVIGGGPGGMEAARIAHERGHQVTLIEKQQVLGGAYRFASVVLTENQIYLDYLLDQMAKLPIEIILGESATAEKIAELSPDAIIVATGAKFTVPNILGSDLGHVIKGAALRNLLTGYATNKTLPDLEDCESISVIGANLMGVEIAELLATQGKHVHLLDPSPRLASEVGKKRRGEITRRLDATGVSVNTGIAITEITADGVKFAMSVDKSEDTSRLVKSDKVIIIDQPIADTTFFESIKELAREVYAVGDCNGFGLSKKAVEEATLAVYKL